MMMKNLIIITGHGEYASGIKSNLNFIAGEQKDVYAVDFLMEDTESSLRQKYLTIMKDTEANYVFVCDILGGTPFRCAAELSQQQNGIEVVCGISSAALMEGLFLKDSLAITELAQLLVEKSHESCMRFEIPARFKTTDNMIRNDSI